MEESNKNKFILPILLILLAGGAVLYASTRSANVPQNNNTEIVIRNVEDNTDEARESTQGQIEENEEERTDEPEAKTVEFTVEGGGFYFDPKEIKVSKGDRVVVNFVNVEGVHDFVLDEFNAKTAQLQAGQTETIEFVADKTGTFEYYCSVGKHREMGMVGNLIVE